MQIWKIGLYTNVINLCLSFFGKNKILLVFIMLIAVSKGKISFISAVIGAVEYKAIFNSKC